MNRPALKRALVAAAILPVAGALALKATRSVHMRRAVALVAAAFGRRPARPAIRVLIMGDSAGLGVGAQTGQSLAALLAADRPDAEVLNVSRCGARLHTITDQLRQLPHSSERWDVLLLHAGGNDILGDTSPVRMQQAASTLLAQLALLARHVVWVGPPNIGLLPTFAPPLSWLMSRRSAHACDLFKRCADRFGVRFIDFCEPSDNALFLTDSQRPHLQMSAPGHAHQVG